MKIKLDIEATPQELRSFFGLPDIESLQQEMLEKLREQILAGGDDVDLSKIMSPLLPEHLSSMESMQKAFWQAFSNNDTSEQDKS